MHDPTAIRNDCTPGHPERFASLSGYSLQHCEEIRADNVATLTNQRRRDVVEYAATVDAIAALFDAQHK